MLLRNPGTLRSAARRLGVRADVHLSEPARCRCAPACSASAYGRAIRIDKNSEMFGNPTARTALDDLVWPRLRKLDRIRASYGIEILGCWCNI